MDIKKYFQREYNFLQQEGDRFAEKHQRIAGELRVTDRQRKDPFVERLFEGFSFLAGRIHERLDDDFPEITGGLLEQLFPHFLRAFPSCAILQAQPVTGSLTEPVTVGRGSEVQTPAGKYRVKYKVAASPREKARIIEKDEPAEFIFRTTQDMTVRPMDLKKVRIETTSDAKSALILEIHPHRDVSYEALDLKCLTLYLHGSDYLKFTLLLYLTKYVSQIHVSEINKKPFHSQEIRSFRTGIPGISPGSEQDPANYALVPYARQVFAGYRLLQEYFAFHERFFFVDIEGLDAFAATQEESPFEIKIVFDRKLPAECKPTSKDILLHCTPIVNLFKRATEEVIVDQRLPEYYILPNGDRRKSWEVYSVNKVIGVSEDKQQLYKYLPVTSYDILDTSDPEYDYKRFYSIALRASKSDMSDAFIRIFGPSMEQDEFPKETLSIEEATLSNGFLPAKYLDVGEISESVSFPEGMTVSNITAPSEILNCPERQNFLWALISHLNLSYTSLAEVETLKSVLSLYNWNEDINNPNKKKIQAITRIHSPTPKHVVQDKGLIRGIEFKIEVDENQFENGEGDIHLFGTVLSRFLSQYVTINSFVILKIIETETKKQHTWTPKLGKISPV